MAARHLDLSHTIWRKSTYSSSTGQNSVEVATSLPGVVAIPGLRPPRRSQAACIGCRAASLRAWPQVG